MTTETPESVRHAARLHQLPGQPRLERTQDFFLYGIAEDRLNQQSVDMGPRLRQRRPQASALHSQRMLQEVRQNNWRSECRARLLYRYFISHVQGREVGSSATRMHPLPEGHFQQ